MMMAIAEEKRSSNEEIHHPKWDPFIRIDVAMAALRTVPDASLGSAAADTTGSAAVLSPPSAVAMSQCSIWNRSANH
jgi:hypothetical protein